MLGELTSVEIEALLHDQWVARLGLHAEHVTYVVPISYVYDGDAIYAHSAGGRKLDMLRTNGRVCVEVDNVENVANWQSVIAWGHFEELHGAPAISALHLLVQRFTPLVTSEVTTPTHGMEMMEHPGHASQHDASVFRIKLETKSGRFERPEPNATLTPRSSARIGGM